MGTLQQPAQHGAGWQLAEREPMGQEERCSRWVFRRVTVRVTLPRATHTPTHPHHPHAHPTRTPHTHSHLPCRLLRLGTQVGAGALLCFFSISPRASNACVPAPACSLLQRCAHCLPCAPHLAVQHGPNGGGLPEAVLLALRGRQAGTQQCEAVCVGSELRVEVCCMECVSAVLIRTRGC